MGKSGINKGGQIVLSADVDQTRVCAYTHWHKVYKRPPGFICQGLAEAHHIIETLRPQLKCQIFKEKPHLTFDNYFYGDGIMYWAGENEFSMTMTCR
jgi:hypothetical protein